MQHEYLAALKAKIAEDGRIKAAWLEGSFGRGNPDRYSDLDIHLLLPETALAAFQTEAKSWLARIQPLVLFNLMFDGKMVNALTQDGLRLDVWLHAGESMALDQAKALVLFEAEPCLSFDKVESAQDPTTVANTLKRQTEEFWRCISLTPSVIGRKELIIGFIGLMVETNLLTEILINGYGIARDSGVKNLNRFLPDNLQQRIEDALSMQTLSQASLAKAQLSLAHILQEQGRMIAEKHNYGYPTALEAAVLQYVAQELALLGLPALPTAD
jgi:hypothetical protein